MSDMEGILYHADFRDRVHELADGSVDCLITDPPYGINYKSDRRKVALFKDGDAEIVGDGLEESLVLLDDMCRLMRPKLKSDAHIYIFTTWRVMHLVVPVVSKYFYVKNCLVWDKRVHGSGDLAHDYAPQHEFILYCWLDKDSGRPLALPRPTNVLPFIRLYGSQMSHPTQKPLVLLQFLIEKSVPSGGLVVDPFAGSGTTLVAAKSLGCRYWGCEVDREYYEVAKKRLEDDVQLKLDVF